MSAAVYVERRVTVEAIQLLDQDSLDADLRLAQAVGWMAGHGFTDILVDGDGRPFGLVLYASSLGVTDDNTVRPGDWIVRDERGLFSRATPGGFAATYELAGGAS